jgi:hypothetical protein
VASAFLIVSFTAFAIALAAAFVGGVWWAGRRLGEPAAVTTKWALGTAVGAVAWMALTWRLAASGVLAEFDRRPPPMVFLFLAVATVSAAIACSPLATRLIRGIPLAALVAFQGFRFPLELLMHRAATEGVMPEQMSYSGRNFDIVTGVSAIIVAVLIQRGIAGRPVVSSWNVLGAALLANILVIAMASTPTFAAFGLDRLNTWVAYPPFVWLPTVMVVLAISGHLLVWRKLATA